jgi:hypothetical protein
VISCGKAQVKVGNTTQIGVGCYLEGEVVSIDKDHVVIVDPIMKQKVHWMWSCGSSSSQSPL